MRVCLWICLAGWAVATVAAAREADPVTERSLRYSMVVKGPSRVVCQDVVRVAEEAMGQFVWWMGTPPPAHVRFLIDWTREDHDPASPVLERNLLPGRRMSEFVIRGGGPVARERERLIRTCMRVYLQAMALSVEGLRAGDHLADPPLWLSEGLTQSMFPDRHRLFMQVVARGGQLRTTPDLGAVQNWLELDVNRLHAFRQQAYCLLLARAVTGPRGQLARLVPWMREHGLSGEEPFWKDGEAERQWWRGLTGGVRETRLPVLTWEESAARLAGLMVFSMPLAEGGGEVLVRLDDLPDARTLQKKNVKKNAAPRGGVTTERTVYEWTPEQKQRIQEHLGRLGQLQMQAHAILSQPLQAYQQALVDWSQGKAEPAAKTGEGARNFHRAAAAHMERAAVLLDWVEVNTPPDVPYTGLDSYRAFMDEGARMRLPVKDAIRKQLTRIEASGSL